ncbi:hypothetical protein WJ968_29195 [Achromobacter xylosoxidans]
MRVVADSSEKSRRPLKHSSAAIAALRASTAAMTIRARRRSGNKVDGKVGKTGLSWSVCAVLLLDRLV